MRQYFSKYSHIDAKKCDRSTVARKLNSNVLAEGRCDRSNIPLRSWSRWSWQNAAGSPSIPIELLCMCLMASVISVVLRRVQVRSCFSDARETWIELIRYRDNTRHHPHVPLMFPKFVNKFSTVLCHGVTFFIDILYWHATTKLSEVRKQCLEELSRCLPWWSKISSWLYLVFFLNIPVSIFIAKCQTVFYTWKIHFVLQSDKAPSVQTRRDFVPLSSIWNCSHFRCTTSYLPWTFLWVIRDSIRITDVTDWCLKCDIELMLPKHDQ